MIVLFCWLALSFITILFGRLIDNEVIFGIGAVMLIMLAGVSEINY